MWYLLACKLDCQNKQPRCHTWLFSPLVFTSKNNTFYIHFLDIELKTLGFGTHQPCDTCSPLHDMCSFFRNNTTKSIDCLIDKCLLPGPGFFFRNKTTKVIDCLIDQCLLPGPGFFSWAWMFEQWIFLCRGRWWGPGECRKILHTVHIELVLGFAPHYRVSKRRQLPPLKWQCHEIFGHFFFMHRNPRGPW